MPGNPRAKFAITADNSQYRRTLKKSTRDTQRFGASVKSALKTGAVAGAAAVGAVIYKLAALSKEAAKTADALAKQSDMLGISTQKLAAYHHAARLSGSSSEGFSKGILKVQKAVIDATNGLTTYTRAFDALKLDPQELKQMAPDQQFEALSKAMAGVENQTERVAIAYDLFGGRNVALLNTLVTTGEQLEKIEADTLAWGTALSRVDAKKIENANDAVERASTAMQGIGTRIAVAFAPLRENVANAFADSAAEAQGFKNEIDATMRALVVGSNFAVNAINGIRVALLGAKLAALEAQRAATESTASFAFTGIPQKPIVFGEDAAKLNRARSKGIIEDIDAVGAKLEALLGTFDSGDQALADYAEKVAAATQAAREQVEAQSSALGGSTGDTEGDTQSPFDRTEEQMAGRLAAIQNALLSEKEAIIASVEEKFAFLDEGYARELAGFENKEQLKAQIASEAADKILDIDERRLANQSALEARHQNYMVSVRRSAIDTTLGLLFQFGAKSKTIQRAAILVEKAVAVGRIIMNTNAAAARAIAELGVIAGPPVAASITAWGYGLAAATAAIGIGQAAAVGGGGAGAGSIGSGGGSIVASSETLDRDFSEAPTAEPRNVVSVHIAGSLLSGQDTLDSLKRWITDLTDADEIIISNNSRQADELRG